MVVGGGGKDAFGIRGHDGGIGGNAADAEHLGGTAHAAFVSRARAPGARGAGRIDVARAVSAAFFADPPSISFGISRSGATLTRTVRLTGNSGQANWWLSFPTPNNNQ